MDSLSDRAWRTFTGSLMWSNEAGTDGAVPSRSLRFLHPDGVDEQTTSELVAAGLWQRSDDGVAVVGWTGLGQELAANVASKRDANRVRQQQWREKQKAAAARDVMRDEQRSSLGQDTTATGTGTGPDQEEAKNSKTPPNRSCELHPNGTRQPCVACMNARKLREDWDKEQHSPAARARAVLALADDFCPEHAGYPLVNGRCDRCVREEIA
jgi:hypothetical protein